MVITLGASLRRPTPKILSTKSQTISKSQSGNSKPSRRGGCQGVSSELALGWKCPEKGWLGCSQPEGFSIGAIEQVQTQRFGI